jgi:benzaldehyde dehydrogenase (NAD)
MDEYLLFIGGEWRPGRSPAVSATSPATGQDFASVATADPADVDDAVRAAAAAQPGWAAQSAFDRAAWCERIAVAVLGRREDLARVLTLDQGKPLAEAYDEVDELAEYFRMAAADARRMDGAFPPSISAGRRVITARVPLGVVGVISPWNFPLILSSRAVAPALALGNAVILKPDAQTAVSGGILLARLFEVAGLPAGVLHVLPGDAEPGAALAESPDVAMVSFTGSTAVGRLVGEAAGRTLKRVSLELGGNNALIVLDDADIDIASSAGAWSAFLHQGQVCMTAGRHIVLESVAQEYLDRLAKRAENLPVGNPATEQVALGPLINERQLVNVDRIVTETVAAGASVRAGGTHEQLYYRPTVLADVTPSMPAFREEIFGPVAPVVVVKDVDEAVRTANATEYGLVAAIQTGSMERGLEIAERLNTGIVHVNDQTLNNDAYAPFGGTGASGNGSRFGSQSSWDEFTQWQWVTARPQAHGFPF